VFGSIVAMMAGMFLAASLGGNLPSAPATGA